MRVRCDGSSVSCTRGPSISEVEHAAMKCLRVLYAHSLFSELPDRSLRGYILCNEMSANQEANSLGS